MTQFGDFLADIIEAGPDHPLDDGLRATLDREGYTEAGRRLIVQQLREQARREAARGPS